MKNFIKDILKSVKKHFISIASVIYAVTAFLHHGLGIHPVKILFEFFHVTVLT